MESFQFSFIRTCTHQLPENIQQLIAEAGRAAENAYAPYSGFKVGAAVLLENGVIITGSNHENAAYPAGICAERAALSNLNINPEGSIVKAIAVAYDNGETTGKPLSPCGICRQTILEVQQWQQQPISVYMISPDNQVIMVENAGFLLPFSFGSEFLNAPPE